MTIPLYVLPTAQKLAYALVLRQKVMRTFFRTATEFFYRPANCLTLGMVGRMPFSAQPTPLP
jgi:hypothetical protein